MKKSRLNRTEPCIYCQLRNDTGPSLDYPIIEVAAMIFPERTGMGLVGTPLRFAPGLTVHDSPVTTLQPIQFLQAPGPALVLVSQGGEVLLPLPFAI